MNKQYSIASVEIEDMPLVPGSIVARKAVLKHETNIDDLISRYYEWERECREVARQDKTDYSAFLNNVATCFLNQPEGQNQVLSPLSIFHALTAMADLTVGNTQREILSVMGLPDVANARSASSIQYRANLAHGGAEVRPAAMMWFDESVKLDREKIQDMAKTIYVGTCQGLMTDTDYQHAISLWLNKATGDIIPPENRALEIEEETKLILLTSLYFHDKWEKEFNRIKTKTGAFHTINGDVAAAYMRQSKWLYICIEDLFTAVPLGFEGGNTMWFVLPKEGLLPEDLLRRNYIMDFPPDWQHLVHRDVHMEIPRFTVSKEYDLLNDLRTMGVSQLFSDDSQTPYTTIKGMSIKVDQAKHSTKIKVDERGCEAASYTAIRGVACAGIPKTPPRFEFILDRPFLFILMGKGNLPLFMGIVHMPEID